MTIEKIIEATDELCWVVCEQSGMYKACDGSYIYWLDSTPVGYYIEVDKDQDNTDVELTNLNAAISYIKRFSDGFTLANMAECKACGTLLHSVHRHDFVGCECPQETRLYIDGGNDYNRCVGSLYNRVNKSVTSASPHYKIREHVVRGGYGRDGRQPYTETLLTEMSDKYLDNLIKYLDEGDYSKYHYFYIAEKEFRKVNKISIEE